LSGPLLDRMDLLVSVERPTERELRAPPPARSEDVRLRVAEARERQRARLAGEHVSCNGQLSARLIRSHVRIDDGAARVLARAYDSGGLSARGRHRILRVARTVADLDGRERVTSQDLLTALSLRQRSSSEEMLAA
jgi:magnesium chelatase family protein